MSRVAFVSGWAGYPELFPQLAELTEFLVPFTDGDEAALVARLATGGEVLMAWSTGAHLVLKHRETLFPQWRRVLLLAPFANFCVHVKRPVLAKMREAIQNEGPTRTVRAFWRNCGAPKTEFTREADGPALAAGLDYLMDSAAVLGQEEQGPNVRIIHGADDAVVPVSAGSDVAALLSGSWLSIMAHGHYPPEDLLMSILHEETGRDAFQPSW